MMHWWTQASGSRLPRTMTIMTPMTRTKAEIMCYIRCKRHTSFAIYVDLPVGGGRGGGWPAHGFLRHKLPFRDDLDT
jgi:hypothetical protein